MMMLIVVNVDFC